MMLNQNKKRLMSFIKSYIYNIYIKFVESSSERSVKLKKNVLLSLFIKAGSIICSLILVPATINFVNDVQYGIWLTISSIVAWMSFFDVGFTNGLRNRLAEAFAYKDMKLAKVYVSTTYFILSVIFLFIMFSLLVLVRYCDISPLLNIDIAYENDLKIALYVLVIYFCLTFVMKILSIVLISDQSPAYSSFIDFAGQLLSLFAVLISSKYCGEGSLSVLSYCLCIPPLVVWFIFSLILYSGKYSFCKPTFASIEMKYTKCLLSLGWKFFVIQIAALIQFQTANILIARLFSMSEVTQYNIAYKYFNVLYMVFMILLQPFWSAVTEAYAKRDLLWIQNGVRKYLKMAVLTLAGGILMLVLSSFVYRIWIGDSVHISFNLSFWMLMYVITLILGAIFVYFVNGIGALRIQYTSSIISPIVFFVFVMFFCRVLDMGVTSILIASIIANFNGIILAPLQYYNIIIRRRKGIWIM